MTTQQIHEAALKQGMVPEALALVTAKVQAHFDGSHPSPAAVAQFLAALPVWDKIGMDQGTFHAMPSTWRMDQARGFAPPVQRQRPPTRVLTAEELEQIKDLPVHERNTQGRAMQQTPAP